MITMRFHARPLAALLAIACLACGSSRAAAQTNPAGASRPRVARQDTPSAAPTQGPDRGEQTGKAATGNAPPNTSQQPPALRAPFTLSASQQKLLNQILLKWEKQSEKVKTFRCTFRRWEYDPTFGDPKRDGLSTEAQGEIRYAAPDRGEHTITKLLQYDSKKEEYVAKKEGLDQWICNGKAIFEFNGQKKELIERRLPPELQGKAISDGPLPFLFGAKAEQLKHRYWMRDVTPNDQVGKAIWLEAFPKFQRDAANFQRATVILSEPDFVPQGLQIILPGAEDSRRKGQPANMAYGFDNTKVNSLFGNWDISSPQLSPPQRLKGWKHVVERDPSEEPADTPPPSNDPQQARRSATKRK